jgi:hypothetical protein
MTRLVCILSLAFYFVTCAQAQDTRGIIPEEFVKARPAKGQASAKAARRTLYRRTSAKAATAPDAGEFAQLGLTIWRLRPATAADTGVRIVVHKEDETIEFVPQRLSADAPLAIGERIRISFESPQAGYLYVINREQFGDGNLGEPVLIFPTMRTRNGDNRVEAGKLIEIPAQEDRPNYFTLQQSRLANTSQTGEVLTVIVTSRPLEGITIGPKALMLTNEQVQQWEQQWGARTETFDLTGGAGKTWTKAEQEAGADGTRQLTQEDPEPQTIYRVAVKPGAPLLVKVGLRYGKTKTMPRKIRR